jgi:hypothetical protein
MRLMLVSWAIRTLKGSHPTGTRARRCHGVRKDATELDRRIHAILDEYVATDDHRPGQPAHGGIIVLHQLAD